MDENAADPLFIEAMAEFARLFEAAGAAGEPDRTAMTVATTTLDARPSARTVLLKGHDARGFVFYTHLDGRKGRELQANPYAALLFHWPRVEQGVQVRIEGRVHTVPDDEADAYFATRARMSQIGAHASKQSRPLANRYALLERVETLKKSFGEDEPVNRPTNWSGFRIVPQAMEFWKDGANRLHDRVRFTRSLPDGAWDRQRLYP